MDKIDKLFEADAFVSGTRLGSIATVVIGASLVVEGVLISNFLISLNLEDLLSFDTLKESLQSSA